MKKLLLMPLGLILGGCDVEPFETVETDQGEVLIINPRLGCDAILGL